MKKLMVTMILMAACLYGSQWEVRNNDGIMMGTLEYSIPTGEATWVMLGDYQVRVGTLTVHSAAGVALCKFEGISFTLFLTPAKNLPVGAPMMHAWVTCKGGGFPVLMIRN